MFFSMASSSISFIFSLCLPLMFWHQIFIPSGGEVESRIGGSGKVEGVLMGVIGMGGGGAVFWSDGWGRYDEGCSVGLSSGMLIMKKAELGEGLFGSGTWGNMRIIIRRKSFFGNRSMKCKARKAMI